jgi:hypothetical protein
MKKVTAFTIDKIGGQILLLSLLVLDSKVQVVYFDVNLITIEFFFFPIYFSPIKG